MPTVADCLRQHGDRVLNDPSVSLSTQQLKVLSSLRRCRTGELGHVTFECSACGRAHYVGRSCGNRHCATCQHEKTQLWLDRQTDRLLPVTHYLVTFTVPDEMCGLLRACPKEGYEAIFQAGSKTIQTLLADPKWLGCSKVGFLGVLHTWGRDPMVFHPHVHFIVPAGAVSDDGSKWCATPENFLFPEAVASKIYRQKFREALRDAELETNVDPSVWHRWWEVNVKPVGDGSAVLKYLAPYVYRVAINDSRIVDCTSETVTYRYTPSKTKIVKTRTVPGEKFVKGFLQHVLPKGFRKVRHYGWMASHSKTTRDNVRWLVWMFRGWTYWLGSGIAPQPERIVTKGPVCEHCGGSLRVVAIVSLEGFALWQDSPRKTKPLAEHQTEYIDTG